MPVFEYATDPERSTASATLRVQGVVYGAIVAPFATAFLPRDVPMLREWILVGLTFMTVVSVTWAYHVTQIRDTSRPFHAPAPLLVLAENAAGYAAAAALGYGLSGSVGIYRLTLLGPLLVIAVIGNRSMVLASYGLCLAALAGTTAGSDLPAKMVPTVVLTYAIGFGAAALVVHGVMATSLRSMARSEEFVQMAAIASRADGVAEGLNEMIPIAARFLSATGVSVHAVTNRKVADEPLSSWPWWRPAPTDEHRADLLICVVEARPVLRAGWACFPVTAAEGIRLAVFVERDQPSHGGRFMSLRDMHRSTVPMAALLARRDLIDQLEGQTRTDALTDLPNRRALNDTLQHELAVAERTASPLSVAMIDLDHFKSYNDTFGHVAGDELLQLLSEMLRTRVRATDFVARYGGEEFAVVLPFTSTEDSEVMMAELNRRCRDLPGLRPVTFSGGIACWEGSESATELLNRADTALYAAKEAGRGRSCVAPVPRPIAAPPRLQPS